MAASTSGHILFDWDPDADTVTYSGAVEKILGYTPEEIEGDPERLEALIHPDDLQGFRSVVEEVRLARGPAEVTYRLRRKDNAYIHIRGNGNFLGAGAGGGAGHMIGDQGIPALLASRGFRLTRVD